MAASLSLPPEIIPQLSQARAVLERHLALVVRDEVVPWRYPPLRELQFGEWLREALQAGIVEPAMRTMTLRSCSASSGSTASA